MERIQAEDCEPLDWDRPNSFDYPQMVYKKVPKGPNSLLHAFLQAYNKVYLSEFKDEKYLPRSDFIVTMRKGLAERMIIKSERHERYIKLLDILFAKNKRLSVDILYEQLRDPEVNFKISWIGLLCEALDIDLYILDGEAWNVHLYSEREETHYLNPGHRNVVVVLRNGRNFSTVGLSTEDETEKRIETYFDPDCDFIQAIRSAMHEQRRNLRKHRNRKPVVPPTSSRTHHYNRVRRSPSPTDSPDGADLSH